MSLQSFHKVDGAFSLFALREGPPENLAETVPLAAEIF
jgi:hypothetical protein